MNFFKWLFGGFKMPSGNNNTYVFTDVEKLVMDLTTLRAHRRHNDAIGIYKTVEPQTIDSPLELVGLTEIVKICDEANDTQSMLHYARRLRFLAPDHPYVLQLQKKYNF